MRLKEGVSIEGLKPEMAAAIPTIDATMRELCGDEATCTSGTEPGAPHMAKSLHWAGLALDIRDRHLDPDAKIRLAVLLHTRLGVPFDVVKEGDHLHVEYDPKKLPKEHSHGQ